MALRKEVLNVYGRIVKTSLQWVATDPGQTAVERQYIKTEARELFKQKKTLKDEDEIRSCLQEAEARLEIALHYNNPYPRPTNFPQHQITLKTSKMSSVQRKVKESTPVYLKSSYEEGS